MVKIEDFKINPLGSPFNPGVYIVCACNMPYEKGERHILYIGSSNNICKRVNNPNHPYKKAYNRLNGLVFISYYETESFIEIEKMLIEKHQPIMNIQWR